MVLCRFLDDKEGRNLLPDWVMHILRRHRDKHSLQHTGRIARFANSVYVAIAGEEGNRRSVHLKNFVVNGQKKGSDSATGYMHELSEESVFRE